MKVIVGLGNPGAKYAGTRHNVGFDVLDVLARDPAAGPFRTKFQALVADWKVGPEPVLLVKPDTFMNLSGRAVRAVADFYKLSPADVLVVCDDFNLPLGKLRVRSKGSHGGQNGLRNIQECLGTEEYPRLRVGVGQPGPGEAVDFVLSKFKPGERAAAEDAVVRAADAAVVWVRQGVEACMNRANGPDGDSKPKKPKPPQADGGPKAKGQANGGADAKADATGGKAAGSPAHRGAGVRGGSPAEPGSATGGHIQGP